jgi:hypothetical protein
MSKANVRYTAHGMVTLLHVPDAWQALFAFQDRHHPDLSKKRDARFEMIQAELAEDRQKAAMQVRLGASLPRRDEAATSPEGLSTATSTDVRTPASPRVRDTSRDAYHAHRASGKLTAQQKQVFAAIGERDWTRQELAKATGLGVNVICGRVKELLDANVLEECGRRTCAATGEKANALRARALELAA